MSALSIFLITSCICVIILTVFIVRLIIDATKLTNTVNTIATSVEKEIEPTLKELREAAKSINSIAASTDKQLQSTKESLATFIGATSCIGGKLKNFTQGILKGLAFGLGLFRK